jgi:hypothetical protein
MVRFFEDGLRFLDHGVEHEGERLIRGHRRRLAFGPGLGFLSAEIAEIMRSQSSFLGGEVPGSVSCAPPCGLVRRHRGLATRRAEGAGNSSLRSQNLGVLCARAVVPAAPAGPVHSRSRPASRINADSAAMTSASVLPMAVSRPA